MSIGQICSRETIVVHQDESITEAAQLMRKHHVGSLIVVEKCDGGVKPVGFLTDRDLVIQVMAAGLAPDSVNLGDIMSYELMTARESDGIWETLKRMRNKGHRRAPVVDERGILVGILSAEDLLELLASEMSDLAALTRQEQIREKRVHGGTS